MKILLTALFFALIPQLAYAQFPVAMDNSPNWLWMPTSTVEERADKEKERKEWAKRKRTLDAIAESEARKLRIANSRTYNTQRSVTYWRYGYRTQPYGYRTQLYGYRMRPIYIQTPTGSVRYWVPY